MDTSSTTNLVDSLDLLGMILTAFASWLASTGAFLYGMLSVNLRKNSEYEYDFNHAFKIVLFPFLYMVYGAIFYEVFRIFISWWYSSNLYNSILDFYSFSIFDYSLKNSITSYTEIEVQNFFDTLKFIFLGSSVGVYLLIIIFYAKESFQFLRISKAEKGESYSIWSKVFAFFFIFVYGYLNCTIYDGIASSILMPKPINLETLGEVESINELLKKIVIYSAKKALPTSGGDADIF